VITAVDSTVLLDVVTADPRYGERSARAIRSAIESGALVACDVVWAETAAWFPSADEMSLAMDRLGVRFLAVDAPTAVAAGRAWRRYRRSGGPRDRLVPDFLIGAHAIQHADRLLSRDRGFLRGYFGGLVVIDPAGS